MTKARDLANIISAGGVLADGVVNISEVVVADNAISGDKVEGGTINAITINTLTSGTVDINGGAVDGTSVGASTASSGAFTTLSASGATTLSGGTTNGVTYLNGSKVLTSGSALTFDGTNLSSTGGATFQSGPTPGGYGGGEVRLGTTASGQQSAISTLSVDSPVLMFDHRGTSNTGVFAWRNGTGASNELARLTSTGLGIGTSSPVYKLDVVGEERITTSTNAGGLIVTGAVDNTGLALTSSNTGGGTWKLLSTAGASGYGQGALAFERNSTLRMILNSSGNLGLGVTPSAWGGSYRAQDIGGVIGISSSVNGDIWYNAYNNGTSSIYKNGGYKASLFRQNNGAFEWHNTNAAGTGGSAISFTQAMTLDASGNLGIGTTSPAVKLDVVGAISASGDYTQSASGGRLTFTTSTGNGGVQNNNGTAYILGYGASHATKASHLDLSSSTAINLQSSGSTVATISSTGLAVTGAISATAGLNSGANPSQNTANHFTLDNIANVTRMYSNGADVATNGSFQFNSTRSNGTNQITAATISSTGLAVTGAISATEIISANKGITFPATQVASADANTLDDYEEGTWTPDVRGSTAAGTGTYTLQQGTYTKTGRSVTLVFRLAWTNLTSATGNLMLGGLPFTINNAVVNFAFTPVGNLNLTYAAGSVVAVGWGATGAYSYVAFDIAAMAANTGFTAVAIDTAAELLGSVTYFV